MTLQVARKILVATGLMVSASSLMAQNPTYTPNDGANNPIPSTTSAVDIDINAVIGDLVRISGLSNIDMDGLTAYDGTTGDMTGSTTFCAYRNAAGGAYEMTLGGTFTVDHTVTASTIPFQVDVTDGTNTATAVTAAGLLAPAPAGFAGDATDMTCGGGSNGTITVTILEADAQAAEAGTYLGVLSISIAPL